LLVGIAAAVCVAGAGCVVGDVAAGRVGVVVAGRCANALEETRAISNRAGHRRYLVIVPAERPGQAWLPG